MHGCVVWKSVFYNIKSLLCCALMLAAACLTKPFNVQADASHVGEETVLLKEKMWFNRSVWCFSRKLNLYQVNNSTIWNSYWLYYLHASCLTTHSYCWVLRIVPISALRVKLGFMVWQCFSPTVFLLKIIRFAGTWFSKQFSCSCIQYVTSSR